MVWCLLYVLGKLSFFHFWGTTFFHCSVVPVLIIFPGVSSVGDESVSFLFFPVVLGICRSSLIGVENAWAPRRVFETTDSPFAPRELLIVYEHRDFFQLL